MELALLTQLHFFTRANKTFEERNRILCLKNQAYPIDK